MARFRSLSARFTAAIVAAGVAACLANAGLVMNQLGHALDRQGQELVRLADTRIGEDLASRARLAAARLDFQQADLGRRVEAIAQRADMAAAIASGNVVAISELLRPAARNADLDRILVVDTDIGPVGGDTGKTDFVTTSHRLRSSRIGRQVRALLAATDAANRRSANFVLTVDAEMRSIFDLPHDVRVLQVIVQPLYGEFGDAAGAMLALRRVRLYEPILEDFVVKAHSAVVAYLGDDPVSVAGTGEPPRLVPPQGGRVLQTSTDGRIVAACEPVFEVMRMCALAPVEDLYFARDELLRIGQSEHENLQQRLLAVGLGTILLFALLAAILSRRVAKPLMAIKSAMNALVLGDHRAVVEGRGRSDEVGEIARSVVALQDSVLERDTLRSDVLRQNRQLQFQEQELRRQNLLFDAALNNMSHGLCMFDAEGKLIVSNRRYAELYGLDPLDTPGDLVAVDLVDPSDRAFPIRAGSQFERLSNGRTVEITRQPIEGGGSVAIFEDVTERLQQEARVIHMASHDALTDLPNRVLLRRRIEHELTETDRTGRSFAVLCLDLDEFKTINDTLGHPFGDELLRQVARRLSAARRPEDLVVRLGGDEFAVVMTGLAGSAEARRYADTLIETLGRPYLIEGHEAIVGVSLGIAMVTPGLDPDEILKRADLALYCAKAEGKNRYRVFEAHMEADIRHRRDLLVDLHLALARKEFEPYFQPQVDLATRRIVGFETLLRWRHPVRGLISPLDFIPLAEETGLIDPIGEWVLRRACEIAATWPADLRLAVNVSARQLRSPSFPAALASTLAETGLEPHRLELEITESALLDINSEVRTTLLAMKERGVRISMDDFGTGYSSLSCLRSFPFDKIKIDRSFVHAMVEDGDSRAIVVAILQLARSLGMSTTAEGIETEEQADLLHREGCEEAQGFLFGAPQPRLVAEGLIETALVLRAAGRSGRRRSSGTR